MHSSCLNFRISTTWFCRPLSPLFYNISRPSGQDQQNDKQCQLPSEFNRIKLKNISTLISVDPFLVALWFFGPFVEHSHKETGFASQKIGSQNFYSYPSNNILPQDSCHHLYAVKLLISLGSQLHTTEAILKAFLWVRFSIFKENWKGIKFFTIRFFNIT